MATIENPLPCPWPGAEKQGKAFICWHCHGTGELKHFSHIANGVCFACKGRGWQYSPNGLRSSKPRAERKKWRKVDGKIVSV